MKIQKMAESCFYFEKIQKIVNILRGSSQSQLEITLRKAI